MQRRSLVFQDEASAAAAGVAAGRFGAVMRSRCSRVRSERRKAREEEGLKQCSPRDGGQKCLLDEGGILRQGLTRRGRVREKRLSRE